MTCRVEDCPQRHCCVCGGHLADTEPQTCVWCVGRVRRDLRTIVDLYALLPDQAVDANGSNWNAGAIRSVDTTMPGGDALVMLAPGNASPRGDRDATVADPEPVLPLFADWEDDWRTARGEAAAGKATLAGVVDYLDRNHAWASQQHPAFDEYADDLRRVRAKIEALLREGPQRSPVPCTRCGRRQLEREAPRPEATEEIPWRCAHCHQGYTNAEYYIAVRQHGQPV